MEVTPTALGVHALLGAGLEDNAVTTHIVVDREVELARVVSLETWQPDLVVRISGREFWFNRGGDIFICVRFRLSLKGVMVWERYQPQPYLGEEDHFVPNAQLFNLGLLGGRLLGEWRLSAAVSAFRRHDIEGLDGPATKRFMDGLEYTDLGHFTWRVVRERQLVTASGEFARPIAPDQLQRVEVNLANL